MTDDRMTVSEFVALIALAAAFDGWVIWLVTR
jgi:hypothetical protein